MEVFTDSHFQRYSKYIYDKFGMYINDQKKSTLFLKIDKAMRKSGITSYDDYYRLISDESNQHEIKSFASIITTNTTEFFREKDHFNLLKNDLEFILSNNSRIERSGEIRVWSAGCSTGQEPYTIAMVLNELISSAIQIKILATDISNKVLSVASKGIYTDIIENQVPKAYLQKYFSMMEGSYEIKPEIKSLITFRFFNLMDAFSFKKGFDIIFCRNVMIYFDTQTQTYLIDKFYQSLVPGGIFFVGHSESLINKTHCFKYLEPAVYIK